MPLLHARTSAQVGPTYRTSHSGVTVAERKCPQLCRSCTRGHRHRVRPTGRTPQRVCRSPSPSARPAVLAREGQPPLTCKSTPSNRGLGRAPSPVTLVGGRGRGPSRLDSRGSHSTVSEELAGLALSIGWQETVASAVVRKLPRYKDASAG